MTTTFQAWLDEPCRHAFLPEDCPICLGAVEDRAVSRPAYETEYGTDYHLSPNCPNLLFGQQRVVDRGGNPAPIEQVSEDLVKHRKSLCSHCKPGSKHNPR